MAVSKFIFVLVVIFGSSSWIGTNSVWMQLPLLTADLPEGWGLPSFLAAIVQIACIGPLIYTIVHKGCQSVTLPTTTLITAFLALACACQFGLVFMWWWTVPIGSGEYSVAVYSLLFGLALVNATSNVLFMPFMAQFHHAYLNAYFVGMGFSSFIPSLLSLVQGAGRYECEGAVPLFTPPRFQASVFFFVIFVWTVIATVSFALLSRSDEHKSAVSKPRGSIHETTPLNEVKLRSEVDQMKATEDNEQLDAKVEVRPLSLKTPKVSNVNYAVILINTAVVNALMNGVIPSVQSYSALPYSQATYHYGIALSNVVSPLVSFLPFFFTLRSLPILSVLTAISSVVTGFIIYLAALSPNLIFNSRSIGSALSVGSSLLAVGLHSYLRVVFASMLREGEKSESRLFWCGVFIQIGSFMGSAVMFPLVNIVNVFTSASPCQ